MICSTPTTSTTTDITTACSGEWVPLLLFRRWHGRTYARAARGDDPSQVQQRLLRQPHFPVVIIIIFHGPQLVRLGLRPTLLPHPRPTTSTSETPLTSTGPLPAVGPGRAFGGRADLSAGGALVFAALFAARPAVVMVCGV